MGLHTFLLTKSKAEHERERDSAIASLYAVFNPTDWGVEIEPNYYTTQNYETIWQHEMRKGIQTKLISAGIDASTFGNWLGEVQTVNCAIYWKNLFTRYRSNYGWRLSLLSIPAGNIIVFGIATHYQQAQSQNALAAASSKLFDLANKGLANLSSQIRLPGRIVSSNDWDKAGLFVEEIHNISGVDFESDCLHLKDIRTTTVKKTLASFINIRVVEFPYDEDRLLSDLKECESIAKELAQGIYPFSNLEDLEHVRTDAYNEAKTANEEKQLGEGSMLEVPLLGLEELSLGIENEELESHIVQPFDPTLIRVESKPAVLGQLISRIEHNEIDMAPDFQRKAGIWNLGAQSRLIESILIRIPIPAFYFDGSNENHWVVVDGLQRLTVLRDFVLKGALKLTGLEFLTTLEGKTYSELPRGFQRRISETGVTLFLIEKNTPPNVKFNIFKRINTGGLPLSAQEIRHALNQGEATTLLSSLASSVEFKEASVNSIKDDRMADRECVLRFIAFALINPIGYKELDFDGFLSETMVKINKGTADMRTDLSNRFKRAMLISHALFEGDAFRKPYQLQGRRMPINKALFETWSVNLDKLTDQQTERLSVRKSNMKESFLNLFTDSHFVSSISQGTGDPNKVRYRFACIEKTINHALL